MKGLLMNSRPDSLDAAPPPPGAPSFLWLLSAYLLPRGLFLDPEADGSWSRWARRRHNLDVLRRHSFTFARRWAALWLIASGQGRLLGGAAGDCIMFAAGIAIVPAVIFACVRLAADMSGDDLPL